MQHFVFHSRFRHDSESGDSGDDSVDDSDNDSEGEEEREQNKKDVEKGGVCSSTFSFKYATA